MKPVPQLSEVTGVSNDYFNEWWSRSMWFDTCGRQGVAESIANSPVRKYEERYSPNSFENVITPQNEVAVRRLNDIADTVNAN